MPSRLRRAVSKAPPERSPEPTREALLAERAETREQQAALAEAHARLLDETQEALERQAATAEILKVIASSPSDTQPVFQAIAESAKRLLGGHSGGVLRFDGDWTHLPAFTSIDPEADAAAKAMWPQAGLFPADSPRMIAVRRDGFAEIADTEAAMEDIVRDLARARGYRSVLFAPLTVGGELFGLITVTRKEPGRFAPHHIQLLQTFADQAVIAIQNARLFNETQEALERQTATAEILKVISQSPTDARPVFERIVLTAVRVLKCDLAGALLRDGDGYWPAAIANAEGLLTNLDPPLRAPIDPDANFPSRAILGKTMLHLPDWSLIDLPPHERVVQNLIGAKSALYLPLIREDACIGVLTLLGKRPNSFGPNEITQAESFRDQALIAIENARLFNETKEALERQTATANVLKVISRSVSDAAPVFETILESCQRLFGLEAVAVYLVEGDMVRGVAHRGWAAGDWGRDAQPLEGSSTGLAIAERRAVHIPDLADKPGLPEKFVAPLREVGGMSVLYAPMLSEDHGVGSIVVSRKPAKPFSDKEIALVQSFADQAAIAIQNTRLFNETQEALEQQRASAEILGVISKSVADAQPVFEKILESCKQLFDGDELDVLLIDDEGLLQVAAYLGEARDTILATFPAPWEATPAGRAIRERRVANYSDVLNNPDTPPVLRKVGKIVGYHSVAFAPMIWEDRGIGAVGVARSRGAFTEKEMALLQTFADQAAIAIQNARLFQETQAKTRDLTEALQQQTATADVLKVISRSAFDLQTVLDTLVESAFRLCGAAAGLIYVKSGDAFECRAMAGTGAAEFSPFFKGRPIRAGRGTAAERVIMTGEVQKVEDFLTDPDFDPNLKAAILGADPGSAFGIVRSTLAVPMKRDDALVGVVVIARSQTGPFPTRQVELVQTFADQAVIAIENARLFDEVQARTRDLSEALEQQIASAEILRVISSSPTDARPVFETIVRTARKLCVAERASIFMLRDGLYHVVAVDGRPEAEHDDSLAAHPTSRGRGSITGRVALERRVVHVSDIQSDPEFTYLLENGFEFRRTMLGVPLLRDGQVVGVIVLQRSVVQPFAQRHIDLVTTFADQAVIAIENVRLFEEVQARTRDLEEALQQQTATANVLKVISRSAFDLDSVLKTLTDSARSLSGAATAAVFLRDGEVFQLGAESGVAPEFLEYLAAHPIRPGKDTLTGRVALTGESVHVHDVFADPDYSYGVGPQVGAYRAMFGAPLIRDGRVDGVFGLMHPTPGAFMPRQMEMVRAFADQAVIAIENARLFEEVQAKTRDLQEALEQQTASAEILRVISSSPTDVQPVFDAIARSAVELCEAEFSAVFRLHDGLVHFVGWHNLSGEGLAATQQAFPAPLDRGTAAGRAVLSRAVVHIPDLAADPDYAASSLVKAGFRSVLAVPMLRNGEPIGAISVPRTEVRPFSERHIELIKTFADQAVIAINNVGLFNETQEALRQQTATADVLQVISRSAFDLQTVLDTLIRSAAELVDAAHGSVHIREGSVYPQKSSFGFNPGIRSLIRRNPISPGRETLAGRVALSGRVESIPDVLEDAEFSPSLKAVIQVRSILGVPLLRDDRVEGMMILGRTEPGPFTPRQIELVRTFADQAVIAIENARLFEEVQARTRDLQEALQQQTATAEVLKVISRSAFDLDSVTTTILQSAMELCRAPTGLLHLRDGDVFRCRLALGHNPESVALNFEFPIKLVDALHRRGPVRPGDFGHYEDMWSDPSYRFKKTAKLAGVRAGVVMPMFRENEVIGLFSLARPEPGPFSPIHTKLVQTFADQAAIAIENVRLFNEVKAKTDDLAEALQQQTATAEVLKVISRSAFDLQAVLDTLISSAVNLCEAYSGVICVRDGEVFRYRGSAGEGDIPALAKYLADHPATPGRGSIAGRVLLSGKVEAIPDRLEDAEFTVPMDSYGHAARSILGVPLLRNDSVEGALILTRKEPGHFTQRQVEIVETFADQAVIAIENSRLFEQVQARTRELAASLDDLRKAQDRLVQSEKLASLGQLTAGIAHEIKNPLNFVNNFSTLSRELMDELRGVLEKATLDEANREEAGDLIGMIDANLDKVVAHGKRADSIVKNMLLHSREGSGERASANVNAMVEEALNLAYHGARAEKPEFNVTIAKLLDEKAGSVDIYAQEMTRVLLNLISNAFYATAKRRKTEANGDYEPTITASTRDRGHSVEIAIRDNGTGISSEVKAKMFNPFFTTKPAGEGTGLGLSLSHDIVVKQHGGALEVSTEPGVFTQFTIVLPRAEARS